MKKRNWPVEEKLAVVFEGLKEKRSVAEICREHQISQTLYYRWRDKFLEAGKKGLINGAGDDNVYKSELEKLQKIIGKQAIQIEILKKNGRFAGNKVTAVDSLKQSGYTVLDACQALGIGRSGYYAAKQVHEPKVPVVDADEEELLERIKAIKSVHPFWGYRRVTAWLRHRENLLVNQKRVRRLMKKYGLMAPQTVHKAKRTP